MSSSSCEDPFWPLRGLHVDHFIVRALNIYRDFHQTRCSAVRIDSISLAFFCFRIRRSSERIDDLTAAMVEEYGGVVRFARPIVESAVNAFAAAEKALREIQWVRSWDKTTVTLEPVGVAGLITAWNANVLFMCLKFASAVAAGCAVVIKPSEMSSLQARALVEALARADEVIE
jgi:Aldehyde dehydrogenase family